MKITQALLSVFDKTGVVDLARSLHEAGVRLLSTGGTAKLLREAGLPVTGVSEVTGHPEIMDGRVKTLHPRVHGGILMVRENAGHCREAEEQGIAPIDLVVVNLYPFRKVIEKPGVTEEEAIENIDIGGPSMVRSAAKNHRYVTVLTDPSDYARFLEDFRAQDGSVSQEIRRQLAIKAFAHTSAYDAAIAGHFSDGEWKTLSFQRVQKLRYGENPHQEAGFYRAPESVGASVATARFLGGKELSYNNLLDLDSAFEMVRDYERGACVVVKHNNPCGAALSDSPAEAFSMAREGDPVSAYGGIVAFNRRVDLPAAEKMAEKGNFFEAVIAPDFAPEAVSCLREKPKWGKNVRLLAAGDDLQAAPPALFRSIRNGMLVQSADDRIADAEWKVLSGTLDDALREELLFAMIACKTVRSNAILIARNLQIVGVGAGQMSRVDSAEIAVQKAGDRAQGAVAASDAFFPFPDGLLVLAKAGVRAVIHPGGSIRDEEVASAAEEAGMTLVTSGVRHFKH